MDIEEDFIYKNDDEFHKEKNEFKTKHDYEKNSINLKNDKKYRLKKIMK